jgi:KaiC/GvpD/RAD55 family RecA-like ATPase
MNILVNNQKANFSNGDFPILISGVEKTGTSFFSICLLADLLNSGSKVLLFSAYPAAKEAFREQIKNNKENALIIESGEEQSFLDVLQETADLSERIILIKNIENYSEKIFEAVKDLKLVIFSGDLDRCSFADRLIEKDFTSKIFFSQSEKYPHEELDNLPKYVGKIISDSRKGFITLDI